MTAFVLALAAIHFGIARNKTTVLLQHLLMLKVNQKSESFPVHAARNPTPHTKSLRETRKPRSTYNRRTTPVRPNRPYVKRPKRTSELFVAICSSSELTKNFCVVDAVAIEVGRIYADLHNDFELRSLEIDFTLKVFRLVFVRAVGDRGPNSCSRLTLTFTGVDYMSVSPGAIAAIACGITEIGYKGSLDFDHDWLMSESQASSADHFFLRLTGDEFIRLHGASSLARYEVLPIAPAAVT